MAALDTNVLVRWLTGDDAAQGAAVERLRAKTIAEGERLFVPVTVLLELEWVLRSRYGIVPLAIAGCIDELLNVAELEIHEESAMERALWMFKQEGSPDLADCLHAALAAQALRGPLLSFDKRAAKLEGARLLK